MKVVDLPKHEPAAVLKEIADLFVEKLPKYKGFVIMAYDEQAGSPELFSANLNQIEKCYLLAALDSHVKGWFNDWQDG